MQPLAVLQDAQAARLFHHYIKHLAAWYDLSDNDASFSKEVPLEALSRPLLLNAILAFADIHLSRTTTPSMRSTAEKFHEQCVSILIKLSDHDVENDLGATLASVCLLRSYEILGEELDPNRHLSGAFALAANNLPNQHESSFARAGFFNYLREDITFSLIHRCPLKIDVSHLTSPSEVQSDEDQLNAATLFLARAINYVFGNADSGDSNAELERDLWRWRSSLPIQFTPYFETPQGQANSFPIIRMLRDCHVAVLQYCIVTGSVLRSHDLRQEGGKQLQEDAGKICGLAFTSESAAVMVNSFGPISFSCRYLQSRALQIDLVRRLQACRKETGWPVQRMIDDLELHWSKAGCIGS